MSRWLPAVGSVLLAAIGPAHGQSFDWQAVSANERGALSTAIEIGREEQLPLYACRAVAGRGVQIGRFRKDFAGCHVGYAGQELSVMPFEVLASTWQDAADGAIPPGSFASGQRIVSPGEGMFALAPSYSCRAAYQGNIQVGTVAVGDRGCSFGYGGRQVIEPRYQVLWGAPWLYWAPGIAHQLPQSAIPAGIEAGEIFYVCRVADRRGLQTGKIKASAPGCSIPSEGKELVSPLFSVLVPRWLEGNAGTIPRAALPAGSEQDDPLFLCRAHIRGSVQIGKINDQLASCRIGMLGGEIPSPAYEVLSAP